MNNIYQQSELDYLIYNDPAAYADLILNGDPAVYLKTVTEYQRTRVALPFSWAALVLHGQVHKKLRFTLVNFETNLEKYGAVLYNNVCTHAVNLF